jgi:hypothetical protein
MERKSNLTLLGRLGDLRDALVFVYAWGYSGTENTRIPVHAFVGEGAQPGSNNENL